MTDYGMIVGLIWEFLKLLNSWDFTQNGATKQTNKKHPASSSSADGNTLLMREVRDKAMVIQITTLNVCGEQKSISESTTR